MKWTQLSNNSAFGPGSSLWLLPSIEKSEWARKLDWYLNLQMSKSRDHEAKQWSEDIQNIISENEIELKPFKPVKKSPLLVGLKRALPFNQVVEVPFDGHAENWIAACERVWVGLGKPSVRLFLPANISANDVQASGRDFRESNELSFIETEKG